MTTFLLIAVGAALMIFGHYRMYPGDQLDWWVPVQLFGALMVFVGLGRPIKPSRKAGRD